MTFQNDATAIQNVVVQLQGKGPTTVLATIAEKLSVNWEGCTPKDVYGAIIRQVNADGTTGDLFAARSAVMTLVNSARDTLRGKSKQDLRWTTILKRVESTRSPKADFNNRAASPQPRSETPGQAVEQVILKFKRTRGDFKDAAASALVGHINGGADTATIALELRDASVFGYEQLASAILVKDREAFNKYILPHYTECFKTTLYASTKAVAAKALVRFVKDGADVAKIARELRGSSVFGNEELASAILVKDREAFNEHILPHYTECFKTTLYASTKAVAANALARFIEEGADVMKMVWGLRGASVFGYEQLASAILLKDRQSFNEHILPHYTECFKTTLYASTKAVAANALVRFIEKGADVSTVAWELRLSDVSKYPDLSRALNRRPDWSGPGYGVTL